MTLARIGVASISITGSERPAGALSCICGVQASGDSQSAISISRSGLSSASNRVLPRNPIWLEHWSAAICHIRLRSSARPPSLAWSFTITLIGTGCLLRVRTKPTGRIYAAQKQRSPCPVRLTKVFDRTVVPAATGPY
jgi:hypothetical protein